AQQAAIGSWSDTWAPTTEANEFQASTGTPYQETQDTLRVLGSGPFTTLIVPYRSGRRPADLSVTQSGGNLVITEAGGTTTIGDAFSAYQDASRSVLTTYGAGAASAYGVGAAGGPAEVVLSGDHVTITASGAAGRRTVTLPGAWVADPSAPSPALSFRGGAVADGPPG